MKPLKIKICGMRNPENIREISLLQPDYMGFIYYPSSKRFAGDLRVSDIAGLPGNIEKTAVFVNMPEESLLLICREMGFTTVQLHGSESPEYCRSMQNQGLQVIKAFGMGNPADFHQMEPYLESADLFLLDTASENYGGSGSKFNWNMLSEYKMEKAFFLSGGIGPDDLNRILELDHAQLVGLDLNSRFESEPGVKNKEKLEVFIKGINQSI